MNTQKSVLNKISNIKKEELSAEKVELALGDGLQSIADKVYNLKQKAEDSLDNAFTDLVKLEKMAQRVVNDSPDVENPFKAFKDELMRLEAQWDKETNRLKSIENELGTKIEYPKIFASISEQLSNFQRLEQNYRSDISEYNKRIRKFK
jgi:predicted  nucleic acid-binding Zn-ribbon protein